MKMEPIVSSETSAIRTQTPGNYPKRNKLHLEHGESLRTRLKSKLLKHDKDVCGVRRGRRTPSQLHPLQQIPTQHDMLPQQLAYKNELNREYVITLARNNETP